MEKDNGTGRTENEPDKSRRSFLAGAASLLAGAALSPADVLAKAAPSIKPVNQLNKEEAKALLDSVDKNTLAVMVMLESGGDPNARNPNSNVWGAYQFLSSTATSVGLDPSERGNPYLSLLGAARLQKRNADFLKDNLGRAPKPYEVYLAHQQGAAGAVALIKGGSRNAIDVLDDLKNVSSSVARQAIVNNGGRSNTTAAEFVQIVEAFYNKSATSKYSFPAGQKWVAHVAEHQGLSKEFLASDPYFSKKRIREAKRAPGKPPQVDNPDTDLRTYGEMLEYLLINPNSKWAKDFPLATNVINRAWGGTGEKREPVKKEEFPTAEKFWERFIHGEKGKKPEPRSR